MLKSQEIKKNVFWVGAMDPGLRIFDIIMYTPYGTTYNSYAIKGSEKSCVFESVKVQFFDEYVMRLKDMGLDIKDIDCVVVNHTEPDHAGSIEKILEINPDVEILGSKPALNFLKGITNKEFKSREIKENDVLDLGDKKVRFISAPFLHWPDTMYSYVEEDELLVTCDSFGCHYCFDGIFNDDLNESEKKDYYDALKYYFDCIMGPFKPYVLKAIDKIENLPIDMILTGHGPILRKDPMEIVEKYREWAKKVELENLVSINYVSAYGYTKEMAETMAEVLENEGFKVNMHDVIHEKMEDLVAEIGKSKGLLFGSPTIVGELLEPIRILMSHLNPTIHGGKVAASFGSYGWSGEAVPRMDARLKELKMKMPLEGLKVNFKMGENDREKVIAFAKDFAEALKK